MSSRRARRRLVELALGALALFGTATTLTHDSSAAEGSYRVLPEVPSVRGFAASERVLVLSVPLSPRVRIPGGTFTMGSSPIDMQLAASSCQSEILRERCVELKTPYYRSEGNLHEVELSPYEIDRTEVTVEAYERCVSAGVCPMPAFSSADPRFARPRLPVTHVSWSAAKTYCEHVGGRLPTEAEWELAARGPERRRYPWGQVYNPRLCNHGAFAPDPTDARDGFVGLAEVGSLPDGKTPLGVLDLAGNAAEWVFDFFEVDGNGFGYSGKKETDPKGPATGTSHVVRGGSYLDDAASMRGSARARLERTSSAEVGFRCAYSVR